MSTLLENLNKEQLEAVTHRGGPLLIVAGAGTGKTTVITRRIAYLLEQKLAKTEEILALTFTEKAATEMEERVDKLLPLGTFDLHISTFHAFCERVLKQYALDIGLANNFKLLDDTQRWILIYKNFDQFQLDYYRPIGSPNRFIDALLYHFEKCKDELITPEDYLAHAEQLKLKGGAAELALSENSDEAVEIKRIEEVASAFHTYQKLLLDNEYLDFGDLINYTIALFQRRPNILKRSQEQFKFVMVDEFQDTNFAQYQLVKMIAGKNLVVVGDDDQSIYKFRGASVSNILKLKEDFPEVKELTLVQNYRSSQEILDLAYDFIQANNPNRLEVELGINKKLINPLKPKKGVIAVLEGKDLSEELDLVIKKVIELKEKDANASWNEFAILIRANSAADELLPRLETTGIPYYFVANRGLYKKPLINDLINYMKLLDNYYESPSLYRVFNLPKFRLDPLDLAILTQFTYQKTLSLYEALNNPEVTLKLKKESSTKINQLLQLLNKHTQDLAEKSAVELFVNIVQDLGVGQLLEAETLENAEQRELLEQFYKKIEDYSQSNADKSLRGFLDYLNLELRAGEEGEIKFDPSVGPEALKVMTIHGAKGLEFNYVFLINLVDQRFPTRERRDTIEIPTNLVKDILPEGDFHLQEERRLFYVALTRAKTHLYLSWAKDYGGQRLKKPSLFLQETKLVPSDKVNLATGKVVFTKPKGRPKKIVYKDLPKTYSYSAINQFLNCPLDYKYRYYLRLPMPGSAQLSFGTTIHAVFQQYLETYRSSLQAPQQDLFNPKQANVDLPPFKLLEDLYEQNWLDDWYQSKAQKEQYRQKGRELIKQFYEATVQAQPEPKYLEVPFKLELGPEKHHFTGKIDRADQTPAGLAVIDYKTGKPPTGTKPGDIDQLRVYQWAAQDFLHEPVASLGYWYIDPNEVRTVPLASPEEIETLKTSLLQTIEQIRHTITYDLFSSLHKKSKQHDCNFADLQ
jgi:DNA helicase II / ATP-dependent DNA helicase PcrA